MLVMTCKEWEYRKEHTAGKRTAGNQVEKSLFYSKENVALKGKEPRVGLQRYYFIYFY